MLEKIMEKMNVKVLGLTVPAMLMACGPSASIPVDTSAKYGFSCCEILDCSGKGYDGCRDEGKAVENGLLVNQCSCYDVYESSNSGSGYEGHGFSASERGDFDKGGSWKCPK